MHQENDTDEKIGKILRDAEDIARKEIRNRFDKIVALLEQTDRWRRSKNSLENAINWLLAISVGTLIWFLNSYDKFTISNLLANKLLFLIATLGLGTSVIIFAILRGIYYFRQIGMDKAIENIESLPERMYLNRESKTIEEIKDMSERIVKNSIELYQKSHNIVGSASPLYKIGSIYYIVGLLTIIVYVLFFVFQTT
jgi:hypothetical protein